MSSEYSQTLSSSTVKSSSSSTDYKMKRNPETIVEDLRKCLKDRAYIHSQYYFNLSHYPERKLSIPNNPNNQSSSLTVANLQLHNQNNKIEMKKQKLSQTFGKNSNSLKLKKNCKNVENSDDFSDYFLQNNTPASSEGKQNSEFSYKTVKSNDLYNNKVNTLTPYNERNNLFVRNLLHSKTKDLKRMKLNPNNTTNNEFLNHNIDESDINIYNNKIDCSLQQSDANERVQETNLDNVKRNFNNTTCGIIQNPQKQSNENTGFLPQFDKKRDNVIIEKNIEGKFIENKNSQRLFENNQINAESKYDRSQFKALQLANSLVSLKYPVSMLSSMSVDSSTTLPVNVDSLSEIKIINNSCNKNSYYEYDREVSRGIIDIRNRRQQIINNNIIKTDNNSLKSTETDGSLKEKVDLSQKQQNKQQFKEYFKIFQPIRQQGTLISRRKLDLIENLSNKKLNNKLRYNKQKNKTFFADHCLKNINHEYKSYPSVKNLIKMYTQQLQEKKIANNNLNNSESDQKIVMDNIKETEIVIDNCNNRISPVSDEGCEIGHSSCSDSQENIIKKNKIKRDLVARSSSNDSALGLEEDLAGLSFNERRRSTDSVHLSLRDRKKNKLERRNTLTIADIPLRTALLPLPQPTDLPELSCLGGVIDKDKKSNTLQVQNTVPSKVLIEERIVEIPQDITSLNVSRRESAQSCSSEYTNSSEYGCKRYVRTPSVVVSDYSDDVMCGITLEEIEYFRKQRMRRRSSDETATTEKDDCLSDVSGASSCSNLYYCGSTISALDGADCYINGIRTKIQRKNSDCSVSSNSSQVSCDEDEEDGRNCFHSSENIFHLDNLTDNYKSEPQSRKKV